MKTKVLNHELQTAADILRQGGHVAVPTETVYGLAANAMNAQAVELLYERKGRPSVKPISLMVSGPEAIDCYCLGAPEQAKALARRFWPGPLTIVLKSKAEIPAIVRAGGDTIGLRCPDHPLTLALLKETGFPLAVPSANLSGGPSPKSAREVLRDFDGKIEAVIDGGICSIGTESTLLSLAETPYRVLRAGALSEDTIADALIDEMRIIGITGGSGSGKTTALRLLEEMGALIIDADAVYADMTRSCQAMREEIEAQFPGTVCEPGLNREKLAAAVFSDPDALETLNAITHPYVIAEIQKRLRAHAMNGGSIAAIDAIGLIGSPLMALCDHSFAVLADREARIARIMRRDGLTRERAVQRVNAQPPDEYYIMNCGDTLVNKADEAAFAALCRQKFMGVLQHG